MISTTTEYQQVKGKRALIENVVNFVLPYHFEDMKNVWWNLKMMNTDDQNPNNFTFIIREKGGWGEEPRLHVVEVEILMKVKDEAIGFNYIVDISHRRIYDEIEFFNYNPQYNSWVWGDKVID